MKVVFLGSPEFAVPSLRAILDAGHEIPLVITQPDRPKGRGMHKMPTPIKIAALDAGLSVAGTQRITRELVSRVKAIEPDIIAVSAFGLFLPTSLCQSAMACINVHPSLLPRYRGAAPIQWAIINGDKITGVTIMHVAPKLDAGGIILQETEVIDEMDTTATLLDRLALKGGRMLADAIGLFGTGEAETRGQDQAAVVWARALMREDGRIDWSKSATRVRNLIRGVVPWPGAFTTLPDQRVIKVFPHVDLVEDIGGIKPGEVLIRGKQVIVACGQGGIRLGQVQMPGKRRTDAHALINGNILRSGMRLGQ